MTLNGAIMQLVEMRENSLMPAFFKPYFDKVIETVSECEEPSAPPVGKDINVPNNDTISRQGAIEALRRAEALTRAFGYHNVIDTIRELPSAQEIIRCKDCKWWDKYGENHGYCMRVRRWGEYFCADAERREECQ